VTGLTPWIRLEGFAAALSRHRSGCSPPRSPTRLCRLPPRDSVRDCGDQRDRISRRLASRRARAGHRASPSEPLRMLSGTRLGLQVGTLRASSTIGCRKRRLLKASAACTPPPGSSTSSSMPSCGGIAGRVPEPAPEALHQPRKCSFLFGFLSSGPGSVRAGATPLGREYESNPKLVVRAAPAAEAPHEGAQQASRQRAG
jgi:hypothetical protein